MTAAREPSTEAGRCPCAGTCHHDIAPCSLGCWAAQRPWRVEEARAEVRSDLARQVAGLKMAAVYPDGRPDRNGYAGGWNDALDEAAILAGTDATPESER